MHDFRYNGEKKSLINDSQNQAQKILRSKKNE